MHCEATLPDKAQSMYCGKGKSELRAKLSFLSPAGGKCQRTSTWMPGGPGVLNIKLHWKDIINVIHPVSGFNILADQYAVHTAYFCIISCFSYCLCILNIYVVIDRSFSFFLSYLSDSNASHSIRLFVSLLLSISVPPCLLQLTLFHFLLSLLHIFIPSLYYFCTEFYVIVSYCHSGFFTIYFL